MLVDNVNFCSPTVLDRLNALLEPRGVLQVTERGVVDGEIQVRFVSVFFLVYDCVLNQCLADGDTAPELPPFPCNGPRVW